MVLPSIKPNVTKYVNSYLQQVNSNNNLLELEKKDTIKNNFKSITNHFFI